MKCFKRPNRDYSQTIGFNSRKCSQITLEINTQILMRLLLIIFLFIGSITCVQNSDEKLKKTSELISILSSDSLEGRHPGTSGFDKAAQFVENYLKVD